MAGRIKNQPASTPVASQAAVEQAAPVESNGHASNGNGARKITCPQELTAAKFLSEAKPLTIDVMGASFELDPRTFSKGSFGWFDQKNLKNNSVCGVEGVGIHLQITATVIGSKDAPRS